MPARLNACLAIFWLLAACSPQSQQSDETTSAPATIPLTNQAPGSAQISSPDPTQQLAELTQAVRRYGLEQQQVPKSLQDLVAKGYVRAIPPAPPGKKFAINKNLEVYLAEP